mgnify:CR=1 FL=1
MEGLFTEVDGHFPNHHPDPSKPKNLEQLIERLKSSDAEVGLAFDGDGDRLGVVSRKGEIIYPDRQMMLFAADILEKKPGSRIIYDVKCTRKLVDWVKSHGASRPSAARATLSSRRSLRKPMRRSPAK